MTVTDETLDELARDLGYRLDIILAHHELSEGLMSSEVAHNRIKTLAAAYGVTKDEIRRQIGVPL